MSVFGQDNRAGCRHGGVRQGAGLGAAPTDKPGTGCSTTDRSTAHVSRAVVYFLGTGFEGAIRQAAARCAPTRNRRYCRCSIKSGVSTSPDASE